MIKSGHKHKRIYSAIKLVALLLTVSVAVNPSIGWAHSFTVAVHVVGENQSSALASAVRGMRLAATERDGHADETADGHLGGLDLFILPRPAGVAHGITWSKGAPPGEPDIIVVIGPPDAVATAIQASQVETVTIGSGVLPVDTPEEFADRYQAAYGIAHDRWAAEGYNAARRIDLAVRAQGDVADRGQLSEALASTAEGINW